MQEITFTRSRAYKKNDQAHVEEKNGSIIRRLIGYDRYEGLDAYNALSELYAVLRLYINFFQPSLKLLSKKREGAKVTKKYDKAKTPYKRLLLSAHISEKAKKNLIEQYNTLDPLELLKKLEKLQDNFWKHAWKANVRNSLVMSDKKSAKMDDMSSSPLTNILVAIEGTPVKDKNEPIEKTFLIASQSILPETASTALVKVTTTEVPASAAPDNGNNIFMMACEYESNDKLKANIRRYRHTNKPRKQMGPRTWRTRKDPFSNAWCKIRMQLELNPECTAKSLLDALIKEDSDQFSIGLLRTLQRRVSEWRIQQIKINQERNYQNTLTHHGSIDIYTSLVANSIING